MAERGRAGFFPAHDSAQVARQVILRPVDAAAFARLRDELEKTARVFFHSASGLAVAEAPTPGSVKYMVEVLLRLRDVGRIRYFEPNRILRAAAVVIDDPLYADQWALRAIGTEAAWIRAATLPRSLAKVAIVDSGLQQHHPDLEGHYAAGPSSTAGRDEDRHGTLVAGTVGAVASNTEGLAGVFGPSGDTPVIQLVDGKFFSATDVLTAANAAVAIRDMVDLGVDVINASFDVGMPIQALSDEIAHAAAQGVVFVVAAGNDGSDNDALPTFPASLEHDNVIAVMASDEDDERPSFSNYGAHTVHLAAPGARVLSTYPFPRPAWGAFRPTKYRMYGGTSAAAAHVSGAAALLRALAPGWAPDLVRAHLVASADHRPRLACLAQGRLNLARAVMGPLAMIWPVSGASWPKGAVRQVRWRVDYRTPAVQTVSVWWHPQGSSAGAPVRLAQKVANDGAVGVRAPSTSVARARLRLVSEQAPFLYAESDEFAVA